MSYHCQCCNTHNHRGKPVLKDGNFVILVKITNLKRFCGLNLALPSIATCYGMHPPYLRRTNVNKLI